MKTFKRVLGWIIILNICPLVVFVVNPFTRNPFDSINLIYLAGWIYNIIFGLIIGLVFLINWCFTDKNENE